MIQTIPTPCLTEWYSTILLTLLLTLSFYSVKFPLVLQYKGGGVGPADPATAGPMSAADLKIN